MANLFVRKTFNSNELKKAINAYLNPKITSLKNDKVLANEVARNWGDAVTRFVPRSEINDGHHLQDFTVSDGRVVWRRPARKDSESDDITAGEEIAYRLYEGPIRGQYRVRSEGGTEYGSHQPQPHWDEAVRPGTADWEEFVNKITPYITEYFKRG